MKNKAMLRICCKSDMRIGKFRMKKRRFIILSICAALLVVGILAVIFRPKRQILYKVTYLPSLGGEFTLPCSINDRGQVAGFSKVRGRTYHLFLWDREKGIQDLGPGSSPFINNTGQIAATMQDPNGNVRAFIWDSKQGRHILPILGGKTTTANGINNHGQVVGAAKTNSGILHACVWNTDSEIQDITPSSKLNTRAWSINDDGQVIVLASGQLLVDINKGKTSTPQPIPVLGLIEINNNGYIAGVVRTGSGKFDIGIWHPNSNVTRLLGLNMYSPDSGQINDVNQVIFSTQQKAIKLFGRTLFTRAVKNHLQDPNLGRIPLNEYVSIGGDENLCLMDINNKGCIIGAVQSIKDSHSRGVLLEPIPERWK
jgi:probable HAF family extracellular repeat protein